MGQSIMSRCVRRQPGHVAFPFPRDLMVQRSRFEELWSNLPDLTILAAAPGWGKTTWMQQCAQFLASNEVTWVRGAEALYSLRDDMQDQCAPDEMAAGRCRRIVFVDGFEDCLAWDRSLWIVLMELANIKGVSIVLSSYDPPPMESARVLVLNEHDLALDEDERSELSELARKKSPSADMFAFKGPVWACPWLAGREARKYWAEEGEWEWVAAEHSVDRIFYDSFPERPGFWASSIGAVFRAVHGFPRFTESTIRYLAPSADSHALFSRLKAWPIFTGTVDEESREDALRWTSTAWRSAVRRLKEGEPTRVLATALSVERTRGSTAGELWVLLMLNDLRQAEHFTEKNFRRLLFFSRPELEESLRIQTLDPKKRPVLSLLKGELLRRREGDDASIKSDAMTSAKTLAARTSSHLHDEFARAALISFAGVSAGNRGHSKRFLKHALELLETMRGRRADMSEDEAALQRCRSLEGLGVSRPSRSALDGLELLVRALTGARGFSKATVDEAVGRSTALWGGEPSSFVAWAAVVGYSTLYLERRPAKANLRRAQVDVFSALEEVGWNQLEGKHRRALRAIEQLCNMPLTPRFRVLAHVLRAASLHLLDQDELAVETLTEALNFEDSARLMRFAFRFVPGEVCASLIELMSSESKPLAELAQALAGDRRTVRWGATVTLTQAETEILRLLSLGMSNEEIAEERFVVVGTVKNQLKALYRKLGVSSRAEAVRIAYELGVLSRA